MANLKKQTFPVLNMHCAGCANNVEKTVRKLVGITDASRRKNNRNDTVA